jgi:hypothetical protein
MPPQPMQVLARCHTSIFLLICTPDLMGHVFVAAQLVASGRTIHAPGQFTLLVPEPPPHQRSSVRKPGLLTLPADQRFIQCDLPPLPPRSVPPRRRPHCCMPVAPPALNCPCADSDLPRPVPVTPVCWPNSSRRTGPTDSHPSISSLQHQVRLLATWSRL